LIVAIPEIELRELERRRLAGTERLGTTEEYEEGTATLPDAFAG
jgi:hypothetical protein